MESQTFLIAALGTGGVIVSAVFAWLGTKTASSGQKAEAETTTRGEEWQKIITEVRDWTERQLEDQNKKISVLQEQVADLQQANIELQEMNADLQKVNVEGLTKYQASLRHLQEWRRLHPESIPKILVPKEIISDL